MKFFVIFVFIGSVCTLQQSMEYHYHYEGSIASGIPSIRPQVAALGIKAKLILQMKEKTLALAKLLDIKVGEFHDDLQYVHQSVPITYEAIPEPYKELLEQPFAIYFLEESGHVMDVYESDVEFITNIRKSIVEMLRIEPIVTNLGGIKNDHISKLISGERASVVFSVEEESLFGRCESEYSVRRLPFSCESRAPNVVKCGGPVFNLIRAINFDKCQDTVIQQHAGGANMFDAGSSLFRAVQSRSSVSTYTLVGVKDLFRVTEAIVEGDVTVNPFGFKTEKLQTMSNKKLILKKVDLIQTRIILPTNLKPVKSWRFEVASPFLPSKEHQKEWVNYRDKGDKYYPVSVLSSIGIPPSHQHILEYQKSLFDLMDSTVLELYAEPSVPSSNNPSPRMTETSFSTSHLQIMTDIMRYLPLNNVKKIFSQIFAHNDTLNQRKQMLLIDVSAASGASAPMKVLIEKMKKKEISHQRIASIFLTVPNNLFSPTVIPELLEYATNLDMKSNPLMTSSVLINFASLVERICINPRKLNYSIPYALFGKENCHPSLVLRDFLSFLEDKARSASKSYEKVIYIQAINNLGSPLIITALKQFIFDSNQSPLVRAVAIHGLSSLRLPESARNKVFDTLMVLVDNLEERSDIRQAALSTLVTWHPSAAWWQRMARSTWREPSRNLATYIFSTLQSLAKSTDPSLEHQSRIADFVLPLLKPFSPSLRSSYGKIYARFDPESMVGLKYDFAISESPTGSAPSEIYTSLRENYGDLLVHLFEASISSENLRKSIPEMIDLLISANTDDASAKNDSKKAEADIFLRIFENLYQMIPVNADVISKVAGNDGEQVLRDLLTGIKTDLTKYFNPINLEFLLPTEIGLPLKGSVSIPTVNMVEADGRMNVPRLLNPTLTDLLKHDQCSFLIKLNYKYSSKLLTKLTVISPWNLKAFEAGVENYDELNLPFYANLSLARSDEVKNLSLNISPYTQKKFPVFHRHNVPFTRVRNIVPDKDLKDDYKVIGVAKDCKPSSKKVKDFDRRYTGLSSQLDYSGDAPYPFTSAFLWDYLRKPELQGKLLASPTTKQWQYSLTLDPKSESKNVTLALSFISVEPSYVEGIPNFSVADEPHERLRKFKAIAKKSKIYGLNTQLFFNATDFRRYEFVLAFAQDKTYSRDKATANKVYRVVTASLSSRIPGHVDSDRALCLDSSMYSPLIHDLDSLKSAIMNDANESLSSQLYHGSSCQSAQIASAEGILKLSDERKRLIFDELNQICNYDSKNPSLGLQTAAVYDIGALDIEFSENLPKSLLKIGYSFQEFVEGALFPHGSYNNLNSGKPNNLIIKANRTISSDKYTISVETPQKYSIFSEIPVPYSITSIVPLAGMETPSSNFTDSVFASVDPNHICYVRNDTIKTFDRLKYFYTPMECWATLVVNHLNASDYVVRNRVNANGVLEAQLKSHDETLHIEVNYTTAVVNGEAMPLNEDERVIKDSSGRVIILIDKQKTGYDVRFLDKLTISALPDLIQLIPSREMYGRPAKLRGLCGDFDGILDWDKTGPEECIYTDDTLFESSWMTTDGDDCDKGQVEKMQVEVKNYQGHCPHRPNNTLELTPVYEPMRNFCTEIIYPVVKESQEKMWCATYEPLKHCKPGCFSLDIWNKKLNAGCWPEDAVPADVAAGEDNGYNLEPPAEKAPHDSYIYRKEPTICLGKILS